LIGEGRRERGTGMIGWRRRRAISGTGPMTKRQKARKREGTGTKVVKAALRVTASSRKDDQDDAAGGWRPREAGCVDSGPP
jgi:hypothetical protein